MVNFKQLRIWQKGLELGVKCFQLTNTFPQSVKFSLSQQIIRAAFSISSNIAEGSSRKSEKEYHHFIRIALGSSFELETQLIISQHINLGDSGLRTEILNLLNEVQRILVSFAGKLQREGKS